MWNPEIEKTRLETLEESLEVLNILSWHDNRLDHKKHNQNYEDIKKCIENTKWHEPSIEYSRETDKSRYFDLALKMIRYSMPALKEAQGGNLWIRMEGFLKTMVIPAYEAEIQRLRGEETIQLPKTKQRIQILLK